MDKLWEEFYKLRRVVFAAIIILAIGCSFGIFQNHKLVTKFNDEANARRAESCKNQIDQYNQKVQGVVETNKYLAALPKSEAHSTLNQFIIASMPKNYGDVKSSHPPSFCHGTKKLPIKKLPSERDFTFLLLKNATPKGK